MQKSPGLHTWATKKNLKTVSAAVRVVQAAGFKTLEDFDAALEKEITGYEDTRSSITKPEDRRRLLSTAMEYIQNRSNLQSIYKSYQNAKDKDKFIRTNKNAETAILQYEAAVNELKRMDFAKSSFKELKAEFDSINAQLPVLEKTYQKQKSEVARLSTIQKNINEFMGKDLQRSRSKEKEELG